VRVADLRDYQRFKTKAVKKGNFRQAESDRQCMCMTLSSNEIDLKREVTAHLSLRSQFSSKKVGFSEMGEEIVTSSPPQSSNFF